MLSEQGRILSENLNALAASLGPYRRDGLVLESVGVAWIEKLLIALAREATALAHEATALERVAISSHARLDPDNLPAGVIPFRRRRPILPPQADCPDGAA